MSFLEICMIALALAMDAFAVALCKGLSLHHPTLYQMLLISGYFGFFQGLMCILGYWIGFHFSFLISSFSHWVVFIILLVIGVNMIKECSTTEVSSTNTNIDCKTLLFLALATSIDALAVGISFACMNIHIAYSCFIISIITFILCTFGVKIGAIFGNKFEKKAQILGGIILIVIAFKTLFIAF